MLLYALSIMICQLSLMKVSGESERGPGNVSIVADPEIVIHEDDRNFPIQHNYVVRRVEETLNLTCKIITQNENYRFKLSWDMPISSKNSKNRVMYNNKTNSLNLVIQHVQENDSGDYKCVAVALTAAENRTNQFFNSVSVSVKSAKKQCGERHFTCPFGNCILQRYVCDGHPDCKNGEDEAEVYCGSYPCDGKITCEGRCIPMSWCCQPYNDLNCTVKSPPSCCQQIYKPYMEHDHPGGSYVSDQQRFSDINFLQTTIYTVIGCAMAFMLIVTILVIAICRVHMKRTLLTRYPPGGSTSFGPGLMTRPTANMHHNVHAEQHLPLCDLDVYLNRSPGLLVTYNINNGVQFVGHPVDPPPYCEVVASPPREGPPPPYASREDLESETSTLLQKPPNPSPSVIFSERTEEESQSPVNVQSSSCLTAPSTSQSSQLANSFIETVCSHTHSSSSNNDSNGSNNSPSNSSSCNNNNITVNKVDHPSADNQSVNSVCSDDDQHHQITITHTCVSNQEDNTSPSI